MKAARVAIGPCPAIVVACLLLGSVVGAAPVRAESSTEGRATAVRLAKEGAADYDADRYAAALRKFVQAYDAFPAPQLLLNLSRTTLKLGRCEEALDYARRYDSARTNRADGGDEQTGRVEEGCPEITVTSEPSGATLRIDHDRHESSLKTPWQGRLAAGKHDLVVSHEGFHELRTRVHVQPGVAITLPLTLVEFLAPPPALEEPPPALAPEAAASPPTHLDLSHPVLVQPAAEKPTPPLVVPRAAMAPVLTRRQIIGWSAVALSAAAIAVGIGLGVQVRSETAALSARSSTRTPADAAKQIGAINGLVAGTDVMLAVGGAAAVSGVVVLVF